LQRAVLVEFGVSAEFITRRPLVEVLHSDAGFRCKRKDGQNWFVCY
jgi:hypothetical protein